MLQIKLCWIRAIRTRDGISYHNLGDFIYLPKLSFLLAALVESLDSAEIAFEMNL